MPIPHLQHKIHSPRSRFGGDGKPNEWGKNRPYKVIRNKVVKTAGPVMDIRWPKNNNNKRNCGKYFKKVLPYLIVLFLTICILCIGFLAWIGKDLPDPKKLSERDIAQSTKIYDRTGEHLLYEIHGEQKRTIIPLQEIPNYAIQTTISLEDKNFYEHSGFSFWGIIRGVIWQGIRGKRLQGGSTLTQQLVKNAVLTNERSIVRKIKELILSYRLEQKYSKDEILQMYFNEIPYGGSAYGIEAAAQTYFGKSARNITLAEAAILAAMPQAPSYYSPFGGHVDELYARQQYALKQMVELGYITTEQADEAMAEKITFKAKFEGITAPHFIFFIKGLLSQKYGEQMIETGGLKIISTLDWDLQTKTEQIVKEQAEKNSKDYIAKNAAVVALDNKTGQILAMVGSANFFNDDIDGQVNVTTSPRQPGSSFKPIVYTAGFIKGFVPETIIYDLVTTFKTEIGEDYTPHNYDSEEHGPVSLRQALAGSLNIPAVKMIYLAGIGNVLDLADNLGYTTLKDRSRFGLSLVLGGGEVTLLEHANAYATLAREGKYLSYSAILKMEEPSGKTLEEFEQPNEQIIIDPLYARMTTDILSDNNARAFIFSANNYLTLQNRPVAAKTGTTNDYHDAWTLGYTPQVTVGVWVGNSNNEAMKKGADGSKVAAPIWQKVMKEAVAKLPAEQFTKPEYEIPSKPMIGGDASGIKIKINKINGKLATNQTLPEFIEEKIYKSAHNILFYVDKENPTGPIPNNPLGDPYFSSWEEKVLAWAIKHNISNETPPTELDDGQSAENFYQQLYNSFNWSFPQDNAIISANDFPLVLNYKLIDASLIKKIDFYYKLSGNDSSSWITYVENFSSLENSSTWQTAPTAGNLIIYPVLTAKSGQSITGPELKIIVN